MPKTHGQPRPRPPAHSHTKGQPKATGPGSPTAHKKDLMSYKPQYGAPNKGSKSSGGY